MISQRIVLALAIALALSLGANVLLVRARWIAEGEARNQAELDRANAAIAQYSEQAAVTEAISKRAAQDNTLLLEHLSEIAKRAQQTKVIYRTAAAEAPLPVNCAPGKARVEAVNAILKGQRNDD